MSKKTKALIAMGGTGGHVFPGYNLGIHLKENGYDIDLITDKRGYRFLPEFKKLNIFILPSFPPKEKNIFSLFFSYFLIFYSILRSVIFLIFNRPNIIFGMGGYASFPICIAAFVLRIRFIIYENNLVIGKANKLLLPFTEKMIVAFKEVEGVSNKYNKKIFKIGNIIKKEIINFSKNERVNKFKGLSLLILGGSQAAKVFAEKLPNIFVQCFEKGISLKIYQQCLPSQNDYLSSFYEKANIEFEIFNFSKNLTNYFLKTDLAITRSGSSMLAELTNTNLPFICVPLPSSADNHQFKNALHYQKNKLAFLIEEKDLNDKLLSLLKEINDNNSILEKIMNNQRQFSDKNVYNNIDRLLKNILDEKN